MTDGGVAHAPPHRHVFSGGCHCRRITLVFEAMDAASDLRPRACDCTFCRTHDAAWLSDPDGMLRIDAHGDAPLRERQGDQRADFLRCAHCGDVLAVMFEDDGMTFGAVNASRLDEADFGAPVAVSPRQLPADEKTARWRRLWTPGVRIARLPAPPIDTSTDTPAATSR